MAWGSGGGSSTATSVYIIHVRHNMFDMAASLSDVRQRTQKALQQGYFDASPSACADSVALRIEAAFGL